MNRASAVVSLLLFGYSILWARDAGIQARRVVILKVDGLNADLLFRAMREKNSATGKPQLPWFNEIFERHGVTFDNFYTRGISLSAPSWSMLDTGHPLIIKGNVEYDRFTGRVYDYLNFFPFYLGYARQREVDMPSVRVLDEAGIPLLSDAFPYDKRYQGFQLFQRGVRWTTLQRSLKRRLSTHVLLSWVEDPQSGLGFGEGLAKQTEHELVRSLSDPNIEYLDLFTGEIDHAAHSINDPKILGDELAALDSLAGRLWTAIEASPLPGETLFIVVSDHGMNNVPSIYSQTFSLPDLLNSPAGGAHHVVTNRHQLSDYKLAGLDPLVFRVINPSTASFYLNGAANSYPTAWLDLDGNERAAVSLRDSELNRIHILLKELSRTDLAPGSRAAASRYLRILLDRKRPSWEQTIRTLTAELDALSRTISSREQEIKEQPKKWTAEQLRLGLDKAGRRKASELNDWIQERSRYQDYIRHLTALLNLEPGDNNPLRIKIADLIPEMSLGDRNRLYDLQHYVVGPGAKGLVLDARGEIDEKNSFRYVDYFPLFASQVVRNNPQTGIAPHPIDFTAFAADTGAVAKRLHSGTHHFDQAIWLYADDDHQLLELVARDGDSMNLKLIPVAHLSANAEGALAWQPAAWGEGLPFRLFEDSALNLPSGVERDKWLGEWHSEREWFNAIHACEYSNAVIGITEELRPPELALPRQNDETLLGRLELRRRDLVQPDFSVFAADHWNFNVRNFNPGGNHGSFLRISTHSVWMMAGAGLPQGKHIDLPYDSLNFGSTVLQLVGKKPPLAARVVELGP